MFILGPFLSKISHYIKFFVQFAAELIDKSLIREEYISLMYESVICSGKWLKITQNEQNYWKMLKMLIPGPFLGKIIS